MTRPHAQGHTDPTVQPVPASVVQQVDAADTTLHNPQWAVVSLGANLGNRLETLQGAVDALGDTPGIRVKAVSPVYETEPWGVEPGSQPAYFNAVAVVRTTLPPSSLLERAHAIEEAFHRIRDERWGPRTLDVDLVSYADVLSDDPALTRPPPAPTNAPSSSRPGTTSPPTRNSPAAAGSRISCARSPARASPPARTWNSGCPNSR
jgi:2-amino-4-hydroxy-6-hydroxymethyldihydropteridine diphosphokinase